MKEISLLRKTIKSSCRQMPDPTPTPNPPPKSALAPLVTHNSSSVLERIHARTASGWASELATVRPDRLATEIIMGRRFSKD